MLEDELLLLVTRNQGVSPEKLKQILRDAGYGRFSDAAGSFLRDSSRMNVLSWIRKQSLYLHTDAESSYKILFNQERFPVGTDFDGKCPAYDGEEETMRSVKVTVSTFKGLSYKAEHYYGRLSVEDGETVHLVRLLGAEEIASDRDRWFGFHAGDSTWAFDLKRDLYGAVEALKRDIFREEEGWLWEIEDWTA